MLARFEVRIIKIGRRERDIYKTHWHWYRLDLNLQPRAFLYKARCTCTCACSLAHLSWEFEIDSNRPERWRERWRRRWSGKGGDRGWGKGEEEGGRGRFDGQVGRYAEAYADFVGVAGTLLTPAGAIVFEIYMIRYVKN